MCQFIQLNKILQSKVKLKALKKNKKFAQCTKKLTDNYLYLYESILKMKGNYLYLLSENLIFKLSKI